jgi:cytochrome c oxidase subunit 2
LSGTFIRFFKMIKSIIVFLVLLLVNVADCDAPEKWQTGLQDPATPIVEGMQNFHNYLSIFVVFIGIFICLILLIVIFRFNSTVVKQAEKFTHSSLLEIIWTIIPAVVLLLIAIPSFSLLYSLDELVTPSVTLKVIGHQWYWSYEYTETTVFGVTFKEPLSFDSYIINFSDLTVGAFRLLEVDNRVVLPTNTHIRLLITAADVLHSWAIPSFGIKVDACPGRLSQASLFIKRDGVFYGQCSEICGVNHGFMPIVVRSISPLRYASWLYLKLVSGSNVVELELLND